MKPVISMLVFLLLSGIVQAAPTEAWRFDDRLANTKLAQIDVERTGQKTARAFLRCYNGRQLDAVVIVGPALADRRTPVRYRFDDGDWQTASWVRTAGGDGVFATDAHAFALQLATRSSLAFEAQGEDGQMHGIGFPLRGSQAPVERVLSACGH
jgi:hypothetical protein